MREDMAIKNLTVKVPAKLHHDFKRAADKEGWSMSEVLKMVMRVVAYTPDWEDRLQDLASDKDKSLYI